MLSVGPEQRLLLDCGRTSAGPEIQDRIGALCRAGLDWPYVLRTAERQGLIPLLYWNLQKIAEPSVPAAALANLRRAFRATAASNLRRSATLVDVLTALESEGLPAVTYKGPLLAASLYGNLALRPFIDLDVLIRRSDLWHVAEILASKEFQPHRPIPREADLRRFASAGTYFWSFNHTQGATRTTLEVHWSLPTTFDLPVDYLWAHTERLSFGGATIRHFAPPTLLILLTAHGFKHFWHLIKWIVDIAEFTRVHQQLSWSELLEEARSLGAERVVLVGLTAAATILDAEMPDVVLRRAQLDRHVPRIMDAIRTRMFEEERRPVGVIRNVIVRERFRHRLSYFAQIARYAAASDGRPLDPAFVSRRLKAKYPSGWSRLLRDLLGF